MQGGPGWGPWQDAGRGESPLEARAQPPATNCQLTAEQRAREHDHQEALRRRSAPWQALQLSAAPTASGAPGFAASQADSASSRLPSALRNVLLLQPPTSAPRHCYLPPAPNQQQQFQQQVYSSKDGQQQQQKQKQRFDQPGLQLPVQLPQRWPQPGPSRLAYGGHGGGPQPHPINSAPSAQYKQQQQQRFDGNGSSSSGMAAHGAFASTSPAPSCNAGCSYGVVHPAIYPAAVVAGHQGRHAERQRGFVFQPPPGLTPSTSWCSGNGVFDAQPPPQLTVAPLAAAPASLPAEFQQGPPAAYVHKHLAGPPLPQLGSQRQAAPLQAPVPLGGRGFMGNGSQRWGTSAMHPGAAAAPKPASAALPPARKCGQGGKAGGAAANMTWTFDPTPQPQKPMMQTTLQQALRRHANATAEKQEQQQQQQYHERQQEEQPSTGGMAPKVSSEAMPLGGQLWQHQQHSLQQEPAGQLWLAQAAASIQCTPRGDFAQEAAAPSGSFASASPFAPQPSRLLCAAPASASASANAAALRAVQAARRPPLPPGRGSRAPAAAVAVQQPGSVVSNWALGPAAAVEPAGVGRRVDPASKEERRLRLQHLLAADCDPFVAAASGGRRWEWLREPRDCQGRPPSDPDHDPTTIHIPAAAWGTDLKGADAQYWRIKQDGCAHVVLFFQEGNFYHLKDRDADVGMRVGLQAMGGRRGSSANMWTVGCNVSAFKEWAAKVLALGYVVGRVDEDRWGQREPGSKLVARTLRRIYSPGTLLDAAMLDAFGSQPLVTIWEGGSQRLGACIVDVQSATISFASWQEADTQRSMLRALLLTADPAEVGFSRGQLSKETRKLLRHLGPVGGGGGGSGHAPVLSHINYWPPYDPGLEEAGVAEALVEHTADMFLTQRGKRATFAAVAPQLTPHAAVALQLAIWHLTLTQTAQHVLPPCSLACMDGLVGSAHSSGHMLLDACAIRSLELLNNSEGQLPGSLLHVLDRAATPAGRRKVKQFITAPLFRVGNIEERLVTTELFMQHPAAADAFQAALHHAPDCERLLVRAANVLATVVERVVAAQEADSMAQQALQGQQAQRAGGQWAVPQGQAPSSSCWASPDPQPPFAAQKRAEAPGKVAQLAAVLDVSQATFLPVVQLFEGAGMMLEALYGLRCTLLAERDPLSTISGSNGDTTAVLPPPVQHAITLGEVVAGVLRTLCRVFDAERFNDATADIALKPGLCADYDAAAAQLAELQAEAAAAMESICEALRGRGHQATVLKKVKLADYRGEQLLEVPTIVHRDLEQLVAGCNLVKESQAVAKYRVPAMADTLRALEEARDGAKLCVLRFLAESAQLFLDSCDSFRLFFNALSTLDVLAGFAVATHPSTAPPGCAFCRPSFATGAGSGGSGAAPLLRLQGAWSPALLASGVDKIQANYLQLGGGSDAEGKPAMLLLTGANTGGKSTLLRTACLAAVMAQIGCYVPAAAAELAPVDRIFTRIGSQDRIFSGQSTFLVEMLECSSLLQHSTPASLVVLDELGRGTATHDGHAIAHGVALWLALRRRCRCLFATHHHGLCTEPRLRALVQMAHMRSEVDPGRGLLPSFQLASGPAPNGSCGIQVAAACRLPASVVARAAEVAQAAEQDNQATLSNSASLLGGAGGSISTSLLGRQPLRALNLQVVKEGMPSPASKRRCLQRSAPDGQELMQVQIAAMPASREARMAGQQHKLLAAVRAAVQSALQGTPRAAECLVQLQVAVRAGLASGELSCNEERELSLQ